MEDTNGADDHSAIHMSLQGKGGVGKSLAASVLAQYFMARGKAVRCIDADPVNKTLFQYRALEAKPLQLLQDGAIDSRAFRSSSARLNSLRAKSASSRTRSSSARVSATELSASPVVAWTIASA